MTFDYQGLGKFLRREPLVHLLALAALLFLRLIPLVGTVS